jgi:hypothetical protein
MKQLLIVLLAAFVACNSEQTAEQHENNSASHSEDKVAIIPLNNGARWKADEATKKNVAAMAQVVRDSSYADAGNRNRLYVDLKAKTDTLIKECRMQGAAHDALHIWLEKLLEDLKELKEDDDEYNKSHAALKKDIADFYQSFE